MTLLKINTLYFDGGDPETEPGGGIPVGGPPQPPPPPEDPEDENDD